MTLTLRTPSLCTNEVKWVAHVLLFEFLGIDFHIKEDDIKDFRLEHDNKTLQFPNCFLKQVIKKWLQPCTLPQLPLETWDIKASGLVVPSVTEPLPILFGKPEIEISENKIRMGVDILGTAFFMLSRYEEVVQKDRDVYNRFAGITSLAHQANFLTRPIVDEYTDIFWSAIKLLWPRLRRKKTEFKIVPTHDVDRPFRFMFKNTWQLFFNMGSAIIKRGDILSALTAPRSWSRVRRGHLDEDPFNTFNKLMDWSEKKGLVSEFYFMADFETGKFHSDYNIHHPAIRQLLKTIHERGHIIGLHPSYNSYNNPDMITNEFISLIQVCQKEKIHQDQWGGRQHYLRWDNNHTPIALEQAGLDYDSTLVYPDKVGFRCGTCMEYPMYSIYDRRELKVREKPMIVMDQTLYDESDYENLSDIEGALIIDDLKSNCKRMNGSFIFLWHNDNTRTIPF